jgi:hypothetical protein
MTLVAPEYGIFAKRLKIGPLYDIRASTNATAGTGWKGPFFAAKVGKQPGFRRAALQLHAAPPTPPIRPVAPPQTR